ncbi:MAG TPA: tetratricopeptide repeat protein, partial [Acidocella sp.]|nr:tetratricopeptide repeat protein [Acidocella sp.]
MPMLTSENKPAAENEIADQFKSADRLFSQGAIAEAEEAFKALLIRSPNHFLVHIRLGFCARHRHNRPDAASCFQSASALDPSHIGVRLEMATDFLELGRLDEAEAGFRGVLDMAPENAWAHIGLGHCTRRRGDRLASLKCFLAAAIHDPDNLWAKPEAAVDLMELNRLDEAAALYAEVLNSQPENYAALIGLADYEKRVGNLAESLESYQRALRLKPESIKVQFEVAELLFRQGAFAEAEVALGDLLSGAPDHFLGHIRMGFCARYRNDREAATMYFARASKIDPRHIGVRLEGAADLLELGRLDEAEAGFRAVLAIVPEEASALIGMGHCARRRGDRAGALNYFLMAATCDPEN